MIEWLVGWLVGVRHVSACGCVYVGRGREGKGWAVCCMYRFNIKIKKRSDRAG